MVLNFGLKVFKNLELDKSHEETACEKWLNASLLLVGCQVFSFRKLRCRCLRCFRCWLQCLTVLKLNAIASYRFSKFSLPKYKYLFAKLFFLLRKICFLKSVGNQNAPVMRFSLFLDTKVEKDLSKSKM